MSIVWSRSVSSAALIAVCVTGACSAPPAIVSTVPNATSGAVSPKAVTYRVLHRFVSSSDGYQPESNLVAVGAMLYGTTYLGGKQKDGTVYSITATGTEKVVHSFAPSEGTSPIGGLVTAGGAFYGTTSNGGSNYAGSVFRMNKSGAITVLHTFGSGTDGATPTAGLIDVSGTLYGTTEAGGTSSNGTAFSITTGGSETVLHSFGKSGDGIQPDAQLVVVNGVFYGTTRIGGTSNTGTIFKMTTSGQERVVADFGGKATDAQNPLTALTNVNGVLYGTSSSGGTYGFGTVFKIATTARGSAIDVVYSFGSGSDGQQPTGGLLYYKGALYGTTLLGGKSGLGTLFRLSTDGYEQILHEFAGGTKDGANPQATLIAVNGTLYGTTDAGGGPVCQEACGTVFALTP